MSRDFWRNTSDILKVFERIIKVLRLVDDDEKSTMRFIEFYQYFLFSFLK